MQRRFDYRSALCFYTALTDLACYLLGFAPQAVCDQSGAMSYYLKTIATVGEYPDEESHY